MKLNTAPGIEESCPYAPAAHKLDLELTQVRIITIYKDGDDRGSTLNPGYG